MSYIVTKSSVFEVGAQTIMNTVNCVGFMGAGLALEFRLRYPKLYEQYKKDCIEHKIKVGFVNYYEDDEVKAINFPTKDHFKNPSKIEWIEAGLDDFVHTYENHNVTSIAIPKLGSGNGGLDWDEVKRLIIKKTKDLPINVYICEDSNPPEGIEKKMFEFIKSYNLLNLNLRSDRYRNIEFNIKKAKRFFEIKGDGVGIDSYESVFNAAYSYATGKEIRREYKNFTEDEIKSTYKKIVSLKWANIIKLTPKQESELRHYTNLIINKEFSFYEFLSNSKSSFQRLRKYCFEDSDKQVIDLFSM